MTADKLKILLDTDDLRKYNINFVNLDYKNKKTREIFWNLINTAKEQTGFNPNGSRLLIEAFPEINGGISLFVSKLSHCSNKEEFENNTYNNENFIKKDTLIFCFENTDDLLDACLLFKDKNCRISGSTLYNYLKKYYLTIQFSNNYQNEKYYENKLILNLLEFGKIINNEISECYLDEHANIIIKESAVNIIVEQIK